MTIFAEAAGLLAALIELLVVFINLKIATPIMIMITFALILIICLLVNYINKIYNENSEFLEFIKYLFERNFDILPKICLELDTSKKFNNLNIDTLSITHTYDMENCDIDSSSRLPINYTITSEYYLKVKNFKLPTNFGCYFTNSDKSDIVEIREKHGKKNDFGKDPISPNDKSQMDSRIKYYSWRLDNCKYLNFESIKRIFSFKKKIYYDIAFQIKYVEKISGLYTDRIIIYPKQFGKKINNIDVNVKFNGDKVKLKKINPYEIDKKDKKSDYCIYGLSDKTATNNEFNIKISNVGKTENKETIVKVV